MSRRSDGDEIGDEVARPRLVVVGRVGEPGEGRGKLVAEAAARAGLARPVRGLGPEAVGLRRSAACMEEGLEREVGLADVVPASGVDDRGVEALGQQVTHDGVTKELHAAVRVVNHEPLLGTQQLVRDDERAERVIARAAAGVADHMGIALAQAGMVVLRFDERGFGTSADGPISYLGQLEDARRGLRTLDLVPPPPGGPTEEPPHD